MILFKKDVKSSKKVAKIALRNREVIGRKNWLFNNTPNGADVSAVLYSLIESAKENGLNPYEYLTDVFRKAPNGVAVDALLPWESSK